MARRCDGCRRRDGRPREMAKTTVSKKKKKVMKKMRKAVGRLRKDVERLANRVG
jgi:hypothetical protein